MSQVTGELIPTKQSDDFLTVIGNSFKLIKASWQALQLNLLTFALLYAIPVVLLSALITLAIIVGVGTGSVESVNMSATVIVLGTVVLLGFLVLSVYVGIAAIITQLASVRGVKIGFKEAINQAQPFFWRFIGLSILVALCVFGGFLLLIIPGVILFTLLLFSSYYLIDKNMSIMEAFKACYHASKANWKLPAAVLVVQILIQAPSFVPGIGSFITTILGILYFCLPAIIYTRMPQSQAKPTKTTSAKS